MPQSEGSYDFFRRSDVVAEYSSLDFLSPPERRILDMWEPRLSASRLLDVGVGGGRTTLHFAPRVSDYVGIDVSPEMVEAVRRRFADTLTHRARYQPGDVRHLTDFRDAEFDLALFSFNGLDSVGDHGDRKLALSELARVLRSGGSLAFSCNNLGFARWSSSLIASIRATARWYNIGSMLWHPRHVVALARQARRWRRHNPAFDRRRPHALLVEERPRFDFDPRHFQQPEELVLVTMYWSLPSEQVRQLKACGFLMPRTFAPDGTEVTGFDDQRLARWRWLYHVATRQ